MKLAVGDKFRTDVPLQYGMKWVEWTAGGVTTSELVADRAVAKPADTFNVHYTKKETTADGFIRTSDARVPPDDLRADDLRGMVWTVVGIENSGGGTAHGPHDRWDDAPHVVARTPSCDTALKFVFGNWGYRTNIPKADIAIVDEAK